MEKTLEKKPLAHDADEFRPLTESPRSEIRVLDDLELILAGGGDSEVTWP